MLPQSPRPRRKRFCCLKRNEVQWILGLLVVVAVVAMTNFGFRVLTAPRQSLAPVIEISPSFPTNTRVFTNSQEEQSREIRDSQPSLLEEEEKAEEVNASQAPEPSSKSEPFVSIIIPFRDRHQHLWSFYYKMTSHLEARNLSHNFYVIEQSGDSKFNRAKLINIGFDQMRQTDPSCSWFCMHDVDLAPGPKVDYSPRDTSMRLIRAIHYVGKDEIWYPYEDLAGGVTCVRKKDYETINGMCNLYEGWGGEDDDLFNRMKHYKIPFPRVAHQEEGTFFEINGHHTQGEEFKERFELLDVWSEHLHSGLSSLRYTVIENFSWTNLHHIKVTWD